jgi:16S rRNA processing protein RimM
VIVGRIGRPHGIRGDVVVGVRTDEPDLRFAVGATLGAGSDSDGEPDAGRPELKVVGRRWHSGQLLVAFEGVTDRDAAIELGGTWLSVDSADLPPTEDPDEFRDHELIGLSVRTVSGDPVGVVTDVLHHGQDLLVVRPAGSAGATAGRSADERLVPFVAAIVPEVDIASGFLVIDPPAGLLDLSRAEE